MIVTRRVVRGMRRMTMSDIIITTEQIDAMWQHRDDYAYGFTVPQAVEAALKECGIERCEKCGGDLFRFDGSMCNGCNGHGWVIE
jgi:hypothetical protein